MGRVRSYRELRVYREAFDLAMRLHLLLQTFPDDERFGLVRQARRSSRSVCANLAEAWRRRRYPAALVAKLIDAEAEASETRVHIEFAHACGYVSGEVAADLDRGYNRLLARLATMRARPERWIPRPPTSHAVPPHPHAPTRSEGSARQPADPATAPRAASGKGEAPPASVPPRERRSTREGSGKVRPP